MENGEPDDQESDKQLQERFLALYATEAGPEETEALLESLAEKPPTSGGKAVSAEVHAGPAEVVEGTTIEVTLQKPTGEDDDTESPNSSPEIPIEFLDMMEAVEEEVLEEDCLIDDEVLEDDGCIGSIDEDAMAQPVALGEEDTPPQDSMAQPVALGEEDTPPQDAMAQPVALGDTPPQDAMAQPVALGDTPPQELPAQQGLSLPPRLQLLKRIIQALVSEGRFEVCNHSFADLLRRLCEHAVQQGQREAARSKVSFTMKPQVPKAVGKRQSRFLATVAAVAKETAGKVLLVDDEEEKVPPHVIKEVSSTLLRDEYFKPGAAVALLRQYFKKAHWVGALNGSLIFEKHKVVYPLDTVTPVKESPSSDKLLSLGSLFAVAALQEQYEGFATASLLESLMAKKLDTEHLSELMEYLLGRSTNCSLLLSSKKAKQVPVPRPSALKADTLSGSFSANQKSNNGAERSVEAADAEVRSQGDNSASGSDETVVVEKKKRKKRRKRKKSTQNEPLADSPEMAQPTRLAHPEKSAELTSLAPENGQEEPRRAPGKKRLIELKEKFASDQSQLEVASTWEAICSQQSRVMRLEAERSTTNMERDSKEALLRENAEELRKMKLNEVRLLQECQEFLSDHLGGEELLQRLWRRLNPFLPQWEPKREEKKPSGAESPEASPAA